MFMSQLTTANFYSSSLNYFWNNLLKLCFLCVLLVLLAPPLLLSANETTPALTADRQTIAKDFSYIIEDRADPFVPFISEKAASSLDMNEIVDRDITLSGMQLFEPGQLTLVALLQKETDSIAMVEDFTGRGYVMTVGTLIGRRGVVTNITQNNVIIEETAETRAGQKIVTKVVMKLKKEGEE